MPVAVLQKKIERLPQEYIQKVNDYVELLLFKFDTTKYIAPQDEIKRKRLEKYIGCISNDDAKIMMAAVEECRKIEGPDEW